MTNIAKVPELLNALYALTSVRALQYLEVSF